MASSKLSDVEFLLIMLNVHKQGPWKYQEVAEKAGLTNSKSVENKLYTIKKKHGLIGPSDESPKVTPTSAKTKKLPGPTPAKKRKLDDDFDDAEAVTEKQETEAKTESVKVEGDADDDWV